MEMIPFGKTAAALKGAKHLNARRNGYPNVK
jgi:hypothetical protein